MSPAAMVVVPTHDHASTLACAVRSVLEQTVSAIDVVIVGDGVGDATRDVVADLQRSDDRVRFVDAPKGESRNEVVRHQIVLASRAPIISYVGDDDLLLPWHVEEMASLLSSHDFVHPFPVFVDMSGELVVAPTDLSLGQCVQWHMHPQRNAVSLTGSAHTIELYRRLPFGWRPAPAGRWSDHYMWEQIFTVPGVRLATGNHATCIKLASDRRSAMRPDERRAEIVSWRERCQTPEFRTWWDRAVTEAVRRAAVDTFRRVDELADAMNTQYEVFALELARMTDQLSWEREVFAQQREDTALQREQFAAEREALVRQLNAEQERASQLENDLNRAVSEQRAITNTRTWRLRGRLLRAWPRPRS